jgi:hypothetical protein
VASPVPHRPQRERRTKREQREEQARERERHEAVERASRAAWAALYEEDGPPRAGQVRMFNTHVGAWEERVDERAMRREFYGVLAALAARGWALDLEPEALRHYTAIADRQFYGRKGDLELHASTAGRMMEFEFFQNVANGENPNGGRYDFDKFRRMPRHLRLPCAVEMTAVARRMLARGYTFGDTTAAGAPTLAARVLRIAEGERDRDPFQRLESMWHWHCRERDAHGWPVPSTYDRDGKERDRDGVPLRCGETRSFRDRHGRLLRGVVFPALNEQWLVIHGAGADGVHRSELFHCARPDLEPRRLVPGQGRRLRRELEQAVAANDYRRIAALARVLDRPSARLERERAREVRRGD